jgi:hypothetical protein
MISLHSWPRPQMPRELPAAVVTGVRNTRCGFEAADSPVFNWTLNNLIFLETFRVVTNKFPEASHGRKLGWLREQRPTALDLLVLRKFAACAVKLLRRYSFSDCDCNKIRSATLPRIGVDFVHSSAPSGAAYAHLVCRNASPSLLILNNRWNKPPPSVLSVAPIGAASKIQAVSSRVGASLPDQRRRNEPRADAPEPG